MHIQKLITLTKEDIDNAIEEYLLKEEIYDIDKINYIINDDKEILRVEVKAH